MYLIPNKMDFKNYIGHFKGINNKNETNTKYLL